MNIPLQIRKAQNIEWILLDEDSESKWTPDDQAIGDRCIPEWIKYKNEDSGTSNTLLLVEKSQDESEGEEINLGRPTGSKNHLRTFTLDDGHSVTLPSHYTIITKNRLTRLEREVQTLRENQEKTLCFFCRLLCLVQKPAFLWWTRVAHCPTRIKMVSIFFFGLLKPRAPTDVKSLRFFCEVCTLISKPILVRETSTIRRMLKHTAIVLKSPF